MIAALLLLASCVSAPAGARPMTAADRVVVDDVRSAWALSDLPTQGEACAEHYPRIRILVTDDPERFQTLTGYCARGAGQGRCPWGEAVAVYRRYTEGFFLVAAGSDGYPLFVFYGDAYPRALPHEIGHWIGECAGGDPDWHHSDPRIWGPGGVTQ